MGAVTALRYASTDSRLCCLLCDSPFSDLNKLALDFAKDHSKVPGFLIKGALTFVKRSIKKRAKFNIKDLDQTKIAKKCLAPIIFVTSKEDDFVKPWHVEKLYDLYLGEKKLLYVKGDHNAFRSKEFYLEGAQFFKKHLYNDHVNLLLNKEKQNIYQSPLSQKEEEKTNVLPITSNKKEKKKYSSIDRKKKDKIQDDSDEESDASFRRKSSENIKIDNPNNNYQIYNKNDYMKEDINRNIPHYYVNSFETKNNMFLYQNPYMEVNHISLTKHK